MTVFTIQIAGRNITVYALHGSTLRFCSNYLSAEKPEYSIIITPEDIRLEREKSIREALVEGVEPIEHSDAYLETTAVQRKLAEKLFDYDTVVFHGSVVAVDGVGYLFTAKSGTGKSTHTRLWREVFGGRAVMVNDDKPFLRCTENGVLVYGSPWNGKHHLGENICVPLKAVCILERGEGNRIERISPAAALPMLLQQSNRPMRPNLMPKYMELIDKLAQNVEFYRLHCNMDPQAAMTAYEAMSR